MADRNVLMAWKFCGCGWLQECSIFNFWRLILNVSGAKTVHKLNNTLSYVFFFMRVNNVFFVLPLSEKAAGFGSYTKFNSHSGVHFLMHTLRSGLGGAAGRCRKWAMSKGIQVQRGIGTGSNPVEQFNAWRTFCRFSWFCAKRLLERCIKSLNILLIQPHNNSTVPVTEVRCRAVDDSSTV
jgi:hypothetical protein